MTAHDPTRILCPLDFSDAARAALRHASALASDVDAELVLVHVLEWGQLSRQLVKQRMARLDAAADAAASAGARVRTALEVGPPVAAILEVARAMKADLMVIGSHGSTSRTFPAKPSISRALRATAACPTLVVPPAAAGRAGGPERVLCGVDFSPASMRGLEYARELTARRGGVLTALHVLEEFAPADWLRFAAHFEVPEYQHLRARDAWRRLHAALGTAGGAQVRVATGIPSEEILRAAEQAGANLVVVGASQASGLRRMIARSTVSRLARHLSCPLLTVPAGARIPILRTEWPDRRGAAVA